MLSAAKCPYLIATLPVGPNIIYTDYPHIHECLPKSLMKDQLSLTDLEPKHFAKKFAKSPNSCTSDKGQLTSLLRISFAIMLGCARLQNLEPKAGF